MRRFRVPLALLLGAGAAAAALLGDPGANAETASAVRVTAPVAAGEVLSEAILEEAQIPSAALPADHSGEIEDYVGQTLAAPLPGGAVVHKSQLVGSALLEGQEEGTVAVPVRPADTAILGLLSPGQRVDVLASAESPEQEAGTRQIAEQVPVLWIPQEDSENWLGASEDARNVVILALDSETAQEVAQAAHEVRIHLSLVNGDEG